jgi:thiol-disulfide isomerase/thioredoxin
MSICTSFVMFVAVQASWCGVCLALGAAMALLLLLLLLLLIGVLLALARGDTRNA